MFDWIAFAKPAIDELRQTMVVRDLALVELLVAKGIITEQEYCDAMIRQRAIVDQLVAEQRDQTESVGTKGA